MPQDESYAAGMAFGLDERPFNFVVIFSVRDASLMHQLNVSVDQVRVQGSGPVVLLHSTNCLKVSAVFTGCLVCSSCGRPAACSSAHSVQAAQEPPKDAQQAADVQRGAQVVWAWLPSNVLLVGSPTRLARFEATGDDMHTVEVHGGFHWGVATALDVLPCGSAAVLLRCTTLGSPKPTAMELQLLLHRTSTDLARLSEHSEVLSLPAEGFLPGRVSVHVSSRVVLACPGEQLGVHAFALLGSSSFGAKLFTVPGLHGVCLSPSKQLAAGIVGKQVRVVDAQTGAVLASWSGSAGKNGETVRPVKVGWNAPHGSQLHVTASISTKEHKDRHVRFTALSF